MVPGNLGKFGLKLTDEKPGAKYQVISYRSGVQNSLLSKNTSGKLEAVVPPSEVAEHAVGLTLAVTQTAPVVRLHFCRTDYRD